MKPLVLGLRTPDILRIAILAPVLGLLSACEQTADIAEPVAHSRPLPTGELPSMERVQAAGQLRPGEGTLIVDIQAPPGATLTEGAPLRLRATGRDLVFPKGVERKLDSSQLPLRLPIVVADGATGPAQIELSYYYCGSGSQGSCHPEHVKLEVSLDLTGANAGGEAHFSHQPML